MGEPAVQGGFDYSHASGLYLGVWGSNVSGSQFTDGNLESDWYGGWAKTWGDWGVNVGGLYYYYPGAKLGNGDKYDTFEGYGSVSWKWISAKISYAFTDFFGCNENSCASAFSGGSDGSTYIELNATYPVTEAFSITGHVGHQKVEGSTIDLDYTDYKIGVNYLYNGFKLRPGLQGHRCRVVELLADEGERQDRRPERRQGHRFGQQDFLTSSE